MNSAKRKRPIRTFLISVLVIVAFFVLFPYPMGRELVARPVWIRDIPAVEPGAAWNGSASTTDVQAQGQGGSKAGAYTEVQAPASFTLDGLFGYVTPGGEIIHAERPVFGVALSRGGFITYSRVGTTFLFQNPAGGKEFSFSGAGYPLLSADGSRLFTVKSDTTGLRELDRAGQTLWSRDFSSPMTSLSIQPGWLLAGLLDGSLELLDRGGKPVLDYSPAGSRISVIMGCAVSPDGSIVAAVAGIDPQFLVVLEKRDTKYAPVFHEALGTQFRREVRMAFSQDGRLVVLEGEEGARVYDAAARSLGAVALSGGLSTTVHLPRLKAFVLLSTGSPGAEHEIVAARGAGAVYSRERFSGSAVFLGSVDGGVLLGIGSKLMRINLEEM